MSAQEAKHTPPRWRVEGTQVVSDTRPVCLVHLKRDEDPEHDANARLIAAAPELYDSLVKLRAAFNALRPFPTLVEVVATALVDEADAALSKVEGTSNAISGASAPS